MAFKPLVPSLVKAFENLPDTDLRKILLLEPLGVLASWDLKTGVGSVGTTLGVFWANQLMADVRDLERPWDAYIFDFLAQHASDEMKIAAFEKALEKLKADFGTWEMPWGEVNRFQRITGEIEPRFDDAQPSLPVGMNSSMWGSLAAYGSRAYPNTKKWYGNVGNSFVAVVEFGEKVKAKSLLAGGQSGDPNSPHFRDQADMYAQGRFKDVNFYRENVLKNAKRRYSPGR
jgi:acyl-homoserine lactone acylase PvdQ